MKNIEKLEELQKIELNILIHIDKICRENDLTYYLAYGTLIGAVRHKGFIPWDDDIDIVMPRPDYEKLMKIMQKANGRYKFISLETCKLDYNYPFAKIFDSKTRLVEGYRPMEEELGVYVDVFPIDGLGNTKEEVSDYSKKIEKYSKQIWYLGTVKHNGIKGRLLNIIGRKNINRWLVKNAKKNNFYKSKYAGGLTGLWGEKEVMETKYYMDKIEMDFEGNKFYVPKHYDYILTKWYGNYMQLPPEKERVRHHGFDAWWV